MTRRVSSVTTANQSAKSVIFALMAALFIVTAFCVDADAKRGTGINDQARNYDRETREPELEQTQKALTKVPGKWDNKQQANVMFNKAAWQVAKQKKPKNAIPKAQATQQAQANQAGNNAGDIAREQAVQAIDYCQRVMKNFTTEGGNRWNKYRDGFFIPMALLLILPGAVLTQVRAIIAQGNPVMVGQASPLEGIQRSIIGVFLVPSTYLVVNYSIDLGNSLQYTIASEYKRIQGTDMYQDAMCAEIRAFGVRYLAENEGSAANLPQADTAPRGNEPFAKAEGMIWGKLVDPCVGLMEVPANRDDNCMSQGSIGMRMAMNMSNAGINTAWSILTAFQMAFMYYLWFVGPIMAALWTWPLKLFKDALPAWIEGVITLAFWSFFWNVVILIIALSKSEASTGLYIVSACNFLATAAVKYAFDFAGLMRGAAAEAEKMGAKAAQKAGKGGGKGGKGGSKGGSKGGKHHSNHGNNGNPQAPAEAPADAPKQDKVAAKSLIPKPVKTTRVEADHTDPTPSLVPPILTTTPVVTPVKNPIVITSLPPSAVMKGKGLLRLDNINLVNTGDPLKPMFNPITGVWENPILPPTATPTETFRKRNTIASVIGNSIQQVMAYPLFARLSDPDKVNPVETSLQQESVQIEEASQTEELPTAESSTINHTPTEENAAEESEMKNVDPRISKREDERFSFTPPPMVEADRGKSFDATISVSDIPMEAQTCNSLLSKMADAVYDNYDYATAENSQDDSLSNAQAPSLFAAPALSFAQELAQVYAAHMPRVFAEQEAQRQTSPNYTAPINSFTTQDQVEEEVITVVDFTAKATPLAQAQSQAARQTNSGLNSLLRNRGLAKAPVSNEVSNSWFA